MKSVVWTENTPWDDVLRQGEREDVVVIREGHAVAMLTPFDDDDVRWYGRENTPSFLASIANARREVAQGKVIGHAELKRELWIESEEDAMDLDQVLDALNRKRQRATYTAVAGVAGGNRQTLLNSRPKDSRHSWVVAKKTGQPTGYTEKQKHDDVRDEKGHVIADPIELRRFLQSSERLDGAVEAS